MASPILEMRVAVTTDDWDALVRFYEQGLGLDRKALWASEHTHAVLYELGRATIEVFDQGHADEVDQIEAGRRVSGQIRFALQVPDLQAALDRALAYGATLVHEPVMTPWRDHNVRITSPDGLQITLFQSPDSE